MKSLLIGVAVLVLFFASSVCADSYMECEITSSCSYTEVLYLKNESGGYRNAHAQLVTNGSYPYVICCNSSASSLTNSSCDNVTVLKLSATTNAHVQAGNYTGAGEYTESACLSANSGGMECMYTNSDCGSDYECLCSIASSNPSDNNLTNAHVGPCQEYLKNVCCRYYDALDMSITKIISPSFVVSGENETVAVNITVNINQTKKNIPTINISDDVPYDFPVPQESSVRVYFIDWSPYSVTEITTNATVNITVLDRSGTLSTLVMVNISDIAQTDANSNLTQGDSVIITYVMTTDEMLPDEEKTMYTHAWIKDNESNTFDRKEVSYMHAALVVVRGYKSIWASSLSNPQNLSAEIIMKAIGGTVSELYLSDYVPEGATLWNLNVTYYNSTNDKVIQLVNNSDYEIYGPYDDTLPDGTNVDVYLYNFTIYNYVNWDGNLYENDSLIIEYNVTVIGGGQWILPTVIAGYDPQYKKHITTETFGSANVPLFDVILKTLTAKVEPGEMVRALLRMINVGGPRARVDVFVTYSAKTMQGGLIVERSETFAVAEQKEKELSLPLPETVEGGLYTFEALVTYTGREAMSTDIFEVMGAVTGIGETGMFYYILIAVMGIVIGALLMLRRK